MTSIAQIVEIFVGLLLAVALLAMLARRLNVSYPILFVLGGLGLGLIPGLPKISLDPDLVFLCFLPPLLYPAALFTSWRDFRANLRPILLLAIGLVIYTTVVVAYLAHYFLKLPLAAGFGNAQFGPGRYDGGAAVRTMVWDAPAQTWNFIGPPVPIP